MGAASIKDVNADFMSHLGEVEGDGWLARVRRSAQERFSGMGLPVARDEYWRFTRPDGFTSMEPAFQTETSRNPYFEAVDAVTLTFVDGVFDARQSGDLSLAGASVDLLSEAGALDLHWAQDLMGALETKGQSPVPRPLTALTTRLAGEGVLVHVTGQTEKPLRIRYVSTGGQANVHHVIKLDAGASLTVLEEGLPGARSSVNMEVDVADGASFDHVRVQGPEAERQSLTALFARLGTESQFKSFTMSVNGVLTRNECVIELTGDDAAAHVAGASVGDGDFHHDDTVFITHDAVNCESRQVFKKVLRSGATGVFQGKILVRPDAQKTDGYQISQGLLLDDDAEFLAKPELEIYADDVACSHGSTVGAVDEDALFYLTSRGVPKAQAQNMLVLAFLSEAMEEIADETLAEGLTERLGAWMERRS